MTRIRDIGRVEVGVAGYGNLTRRIVRGTSIVIPEQAQGYLINVIQLPPGSTLDHTEKVVQCGIDVILGTKGVEACGAVRRSSMLQPSR